MSLFSVLESVYGDETSALVRWIDEEQPDDVEKVVQRLLHHEPIQYIFGHTLWRGLDLVVNKNVLIPRPETSDLVDIVLHENSTNHPLRVLDIGTGSGCIAIALKQKRPTWEITGIDISHEALKVASQNALRNHTEVTFKQQDLFKDTMGTYDIVVSNPPYVCEREKATMDKNVLDYEPSQALFVPDTSPLLYYERIADIHIGGKIYLEVSESHAHEVERLFINKGYDDVQVSKDFFGKERIVRCTTHVKDV